MCMSKHIVVIEDNPDLREIIIYTLESEGFRVMGLSCLTSFEELEALAADCFLVDEHLPGTSGHIICILLKSKPQTRGIPVILMSAFDGLIERAGLCEADAFLKNPFEPLNELFSTVNHLAYKVA